VLGEARSQRVGKERDDLRKVIGMYSERTVVRSDKRRERLIASGSLGHLRVHLGTIGGSHLSTGMWGTDAMLPHNSREQPAK